MTEEELIVQTAWLYYVYEENQEAIARQLGISRFKVMRLLASAKSSGLVQISVNHEAPVTLELSRRLSERLKIAQCVVTPPIELAETRSESDKEMLARRAVGVAAATHLAARCEGKLTIGLGWGSTLAEFAGAFRQVRNADLQFVSLAGSLLRNSAANPFEVVQSLARNTGGQAFFLPAPYIVDREVDVPVILSQKIVQASLEMARMAAFYVVGAGTCSTQSTAYRHGLLSDAELRSLRAAGAICETTGVYFDKHGQQVHTDLTARTIGIGYDDLMSREVVLLASGQSKIETVKALSKSGIINCLVLDGDTAKRLLEEV